MSDKQQFVDRGFRSIGTASNVEYLAKIDEDNEIVYVTCYNDKILGNPKSIELDELKLFVNAFLKS